MYQVTSAMYAMSIVGSVLVGVSVLAAMVAGIMLFPDFLRYVKIKSM